jgi:hypothetical protein
MSSSRKKIFFIFLASVLAVVRTGSPRGRDAARQRARIGNDSSVT